jgi:hypothetical protein
MSDAVCIALEGEPTKEQLTLRVEDFNGRIPRSAIRPGEHRTAP